jgi:hypothetical protein
MLHRKQAKSAGITTHPQLNIRLILQLGGRPETTIVLREM